MERVRVGVWGTGTWGEKHARVYAALSQANLAGVFDTDPERARTVAAQHGTRAFETPEALLAACEAVSIAVPTVAHRSAVQQAAAAGVHALVEKPMAPSLADADAMIAVARAAGTTLQVGQVERFNPALIACRGSIRDVRFVEAHRMALFQPRSLDVDVVFDLMIHDIDIVLDALGQFPILVSAVGVAVLSENEDIANARLEFADGAVANLTASRVSQERLRRIRFFQGNAYLSIDLFGRRIDHLSIDRDRLTAKAAHPLARASAITKHEPVLEDGEPLTLELAAFLDSLRGHGPGAASAKAGRDALAVAEQVRAAMQERNRQWAGRPSAVS